MSSFSETAARFPDVTASLVAARAKGRLAHSFMVISESEETRREYALFLAQIAACPTPCEDGSPDLNCPVCRALAKGSYGDLHNLVPVGKMYQIRVGDLTNPEPNTVRSFMNTLYLTGSIGGRKIGIIHEADRMNRESQNALLKTLEEPPRDTTLILCTANPGSLLATTRSRCQQIRLPDHEHIFDFPGKEEVTAALHELVFNGLNDPGRAENAASVLIRVADGLEAGAAAGVDERFDSAIAAAESVGDNALRKRLENRKNDEISGAFMRSRARFLGLIQAYCSQVFMLSCGIVPGELPHPELFEAIQPLPVTTPERGDFVLRQAEELCRTLHYNVSLELALRTFALQLAL